MERVADAIARACANSPFLAGLMDRNADLMPLIHAGDFDTALANALARSADLVGTNFTNTNLHGADIRNTNLVGNYNIWKNTTCPNGTVTNTGC